MLSKLVEMIRGARSSIMLVTPAETLEESAPLLEAIAGPRSHEGVKIRIMTDEADLKGLPEGVEARTGNIVAFDLLVDDNTALIGLPDLSAAAGSRAARSRATSCSSSSSCGARVKSEGRCQRTLQPPEMEVEGATRPPKKDGRMTLL